MDEMVEVGDNNTTETTEVQSYASIYAAIYLRLFMRSGSLEKR
jgi:hypothetical protein